MTRAALSAKPALREAGCSLKERRYICKAGRNYNFMEELHLGKATRSVSSRRGSKCFAQRGGTIRILSILLGAENVPPPRFCLPSGDKWSDEKKFVR